MSKSNDTLNQFELKNRLVLIPEIGRFKWIKCRDIKRRGQLAGSISKHLGYRIIHIAGMPRFEHRLVWLYVYGEWPKHTIDHIDLDRTNNRIENLRDVPDAINQQNKNKREFGGTYKGATHTDGTVIWYAKITINGKQIHLGSFKDRKDATNAHSEARKIYHPGCAQL